MSTKDYDELEKLFGGRWKSDRTENLDEWLAASEMSDEGKSFFKLEYVITVSREGQSIKDKVVYGPGMEFETVYRLNESKVAKDNEENPKFMYKTTHQFKDGVLTQEIEPLTANVGRRYYSKSSLVGGELVEELRFHAAPHVTAKRFYKRC